MNVVQSNPNKAAVGCKFHISCSNASQRDTTDARMILQVQVSEIRPSAQHSFGRKKSFICLISAIIVILGETALGAEDGKQADGGEAI
jgi:hypothetical protein